MKHSTRSHSGIETLESRIAPAATFIFAANGGVVKTFADADINDTHETLVESFVPFPGYRLELRVASGDFNGDGNDELAVATAGLNPRVVIYQLASDGTRIGAGEVFTPFAGTKTVGAWLAAGDLNNDGRAELAIGAGHNGPATVKIYSDGNADGKLGDNLVDTIAVFNATFKGGVRVAMGNTNNLGGAELIAAAGRGVNGQIKIYTDADANLNLSTNPSEVIETFTPFGPKFTGGLIVAAGLLENVGSSGAEVMVGRSSASKDFSVFTDSDFDGNVSDDAVFEVVTASATPVAGGLRLAAGDTDDSGAFVEVIAATGGGKKLPLQVFDDNADADPKISDNAPGDSFAAFNVGTVTNVAFGKVRKAQAASMSNSAIPEAGTLVASIQAPSNIGIIRDLDLDLFIGHTFNGDLDVSLTHVPSGITVILFTDIGGTDEGLIIRLNDEAATDIGTADNPNDGAVTGSFNLEGAAALSDFDGIDGSGEWRLTVTDDTAAGADVGTLFGWTLQFSV